MPAFATGSAQTIEIVTFKLKSGRLQSTPTRYLKPFRPLHVRWTRPGAIHLSAFDLLAFNRRDLRLQPLLKRQSRACRPC
jgi:hypothetical protein